MHVSVDFSPPLSATVNWKVRDVPPDPTLGDVNVGLAVVESDMVTEGPQSVPTDRRRCHCLGRSNWTR